MDNDNSMIKLDEVDLLKLQLQLKEFERLQIAIDNYILNLFMKYKISNTEYNIDIQQGAFVKKEKK